MEKSEMIKVVGEKIKGIHTASFTTHDKEGNFASRPMGTQDIEFDGTLWFMTQNDSDKANQIKADPIVGLSYMSDDKARFVSISGKAELVYDPEKIKEYWNEFYKAWFDGPEDPRITLIKVNVTRVEYWDMPGGRIAELATMAKAALTGDKQHESDEENEVFEFND